jgi:hypothetical protein
MVYNSRFLYELPEIHNVIQKQQKKKKNKSGAKELKIALIYAFSTMSRHSICWLSLSPLLSLLQMGGRVAIAVELNLYSCRFVFLRWIGQNSTPMSIGIDIFLEKFITQGICPVEAMTRGSKSSVKIRRSCWRKHVSRLFRLRYI